MTKSDRKENSSSNTPMHPKPEPTSKIKHFKELLSRGSLILDAGCGNGKNSIYLKEEGFNVTGIDISEHQIKTAKKADSSGINFEQGDITNLPYEAETFDGAFCTYSLEACDYNKALKEISRVLKKEGYLIIVSLYKIEYHHFKPFDFEVPIGQLFSAVSKYFTVIEKKLDSYKESDRYGLNTRYRIQLVLQKNKELLV